MLRRLLLVSLVSCALAQQVPRKAPDWAIDTTQGKPITLGQYKGKAVLLAFILTTCSHCRLTVGYLANDQRQYGPRGLQVLATASDRGVPGVIPAFVKELQVPFPVGYNTNGDAMLSFLGYDRQHLPHLPILLFIDRQGVIREQHEGMDQTNYFKEREEQNIQASIEALLKR